MGKGLNSKKPSAFRTRQPRGVVQMSDVDPFIALSLTAPPLFIPHFRSLSSPKFLFFFFLSLFPKLFPLQFCLLLTHSLTSKSRLWRLLLLRSYSSRFVSTILRLGNSPIVEITLFSVFFTLPLFFIFPTKLLLKLS